MEESQICKFFNDQTVFITGGTGFLGKVLIEKLLRVCPDLKKIYVMVRPKKGKSTQERFDAIFDFPCFQTIKSMNIDYKSRVHLIEGESSKPNLGLSITETELLKTEVTVLIHAAANVKFDQSLREAAENNIRPLYTILNLAREMLNLKALLYISTAFSNCPHLQIKEDFYEPPMNSRALFALLDSVNDSVLEKITPIILGQFPNTYVFSKCLAEDLVKSDGQGLPIAVVRPPIVISSHKEPVPGWTDNFYGVGGIVMAAALGVLRSLHADPDLTAWVSPVDHVSNGVLAVAWDLGTKKGGSDQKILVYNCICCSKDKTVTWRRLCESIDGCARDYGSEKVVWHYCFAMRKCYWWHTICVFFQHTVVAYIVDFVLICIGKQPLAVKNYARLDKMLNLLSYFTTKNFDFDVDNIWKLWNKMTPVDQEIFHFNGDDIDLDTFYRTSIMGGRLYLLKDPPETIPKGKRKLKILMVLHYTLLSILWFLLYKLVSWLFHRLF